MAVAVLVAFGTSAARAQTGDASSQQALHIDVRACELEVLGEGPLREALQLELTPRTGSATGAPHSPVALELSCEGSGLARLVIRADDDQTTRRRMLFLGDVPPADRARTVALAAAELVRGPAEQAVEDIAAEPREPASAPESSSEAAIPSAATPVESASDLPPPAPEAPSRATAQLESTASEPAPRQVDAPTEASSRIALRIGGELRAFASPFTLAGGVRGALWWEWIGVEAAALWAAHATDLGTARASLIAGGPVVRILSSRLGNVPVGLHLAIELGAATVSGDPIDGAAATSATDVFYAARFGGNVEPFVVGPVAVHLTLGAGYGGGPVGRVAGQPSVTASGFFVAATLGLRIPPDDSVRR